jgi:hypothetical protein
MINVYVNAIQLRAADRCDSAGACTSGVVKSDTPNADVPKTTTTSPQKIWKW